MKPQVLCPVCGSEALVPGRHTLELGVGDRKVTVSGLEHYDCPSCGADPAFVEQIRRNELKIADAKRRTQGLLTAAEIREFREDLGLSQAGAAALFGGGSNAFSKYERGAVIQSVPMDRLLRVAHAFPYTVAFLRAECGIDFGAFTGATAGTRPQFYFAAPAQSASGALVPLEPSLTVMAS
jgi:HTH-type transcriptional regulator / antitoxin MqsA